VLALHLTIPRKTLSLYIPLKKSFKFLKKIIIKISEIPPFYFFLKLLKSNKKKVLKKTLKKTRQKNSLQKQNKKKHKKTS